MILGLTYNISSNKYTSNIEQCITLSDKYNKATLEINDNKLILNLFTDVHRVIKFEVIVDINSDIIIDVIPLNRNQSELDTYINDMIYTIIGCEFICSKNDKNKLRPKIDDDDKKMLSFYSNNKNKDLIINSITFNNGSVITPIYNDDSIVRDNLSENKYYYNDDFCNDDICFDYDSDTEATCAYNYLTKIHEKLKKLIESYIDCNDLFNKSEKENMSILEYLMKYESYNNIYSKIVDMVDLDSLVEILLEGIERGIDWLDDDNID